MIPLLLALIALDTSKVVVVPVFVGARTLRASNVQAVARRSVEARAQLRLIAQEEVFVLGGEALERSLAQCGALVECQARSLDVLSAQLGLIVAVNALTETPFVDVRLVDIAARRLRARAGGLLKGAASVALKNWIEQALTEGGFPAAARLLVTLEPPQARARLEGDQPLAGALPGAVILRPGNYRVVASAQDYEPGLAALQLAPGERRKLKLSLALKPRPLSDATWIWIAAGGAAVLTAVTVGAVLATRRDCICAGANCPTCR